MFFNNHCNCSVLVLSAMKGVIMLLAHLSKPKKKKMQKGGPFLTYSWTKCATE